MYIKNLLTRIIILITFIATLVACNAPTHEKKVGIIVPIEFKAINDIVAGFQDTLNKESTTPIKFKIANAQGDLNLQRAIIQQMRDENMDLIVPVGTAATQMTLSMVKNTPIVSLAANMDNEDRQKLKNCNIAIVHDEISPTQIVAFIHQAYPKLTQIVLVHSTTDKMFPEVKTAIAAGKKFGLNIKAIPVPTLNDLYSVANNFPKNTQGILILKDMLIASGITTLEQVAEKQQIPLITADEGSVQDGAGVGLGVLERHIGVYGANLATSIFNGSKACQLPIVDMQKLTVFLNKKSLLKEGQSTNTIISVAKQNDYGILNLGGNA